MMRKPLIAASTLLFAVLVLPSIARAQYPSPPLPLFPGQVLGPLAPLDAPLLPDTQPQFVNPLPVPVDYTPDTTTYPGWDYYEIAYAPVTGTAPFSSVGAPPGTQWLGLVDPANPLVKLYTPVWGFGQVNMGGGPLASAATYPSMNIRATQGRPVKVKWINNLPDAHLFCPQPQNVNWPCAIDRTLMGAEGFLGVGPYGSFQSPDNAVVVHLHGGEIPPEADGFAELWFGNANSANDPQYAADLSIDPPLSYASPIPGAVSLALMRPVGNSVLYNYPNVQHAATLWFHDHALGKTRINVAAGPAGFYLLNSTAEPAGLPSGPYEIVLAIQDRAFNLPQPGSNLATINFPNGLNHLQVAPTLLQTPLTPSPNTSTDPLKDYGHPQWIPEYFGDVSVVNGMAWPFLDVEPRRYRFRLLDGSNARCWALNLADATTGVAVLWTQIGTDGGYLPAPVPVEKLTLCPGERADVIVDFTGMAPGTLVNMTNNAPAPFPKGVAPKQKDVGRVMQFRVNLPLSGVDTSVVPAVLDPAFAPLVPPAGTVPRELVLNEQLDPITLFPMKVQIDGKAFEDPITETPKRGAIEVWSFINTTGDAHPIHLHLVQFQVVSRQKFDAAKYSALTGFGVPGVANFTKLAIAPFLTGGAKLPLANEIGWKDTVQTFPGQVTTVIAQFQGNWDTVVADPANPAVPAFLPETAGPYVWHCHIVDHEDNEMMRPLVVVP